MDRNFTGQLAKTLNVDLSHPAGGAWIEINGAQKLFALASVAPRRGCVDRNSALNGFSICIIRRTPQGVRG